MGSLTLQSCMLSLATVACCWHSVNLIQTPSLQVGGIPFTVYKSQLTLTDPCDAVSRPLLDAGMYWGDDRPSTVDSAWLPSTVAKCCQQQIKNCQHAMA